MTDESTSGDRIPPPDRPRQADFRRSRWFGWIWAVPIAALGIVAWLGVTALTSSGPHVTVSFPGAPDIKAGSTQVKFHGQQVGDVESVKLARDLKHTVVGISLHPELANHLGPNSRFWLQGGSLSLNDLGDLTTILSGPFIGMDPQPGKATHHFAGLAQEPILEGTPAGHSFTLHAPKLGTISRGSDVTTIGLDVGKVLDTALAPDGKGVTIGIFVNAPYDKLVHDGTRFWNAGAVQLTTGANGPGVQFQSVPALFTGAISFETPHPALAGPPAADKAGFTLYPGKSAAEAAPTPEALRYQAEFDDPSGPLPDGAAVTLAGHRIGSVQHASLSFDPATQHLRLVAKILLEPSEMPADPGAAKPRETGGAKPRETGGAKPRETMDSMLGALIAQGLRAGLQSTPPVIGAQQVALRFVKDAPPASLGSGPVPDIPTTAGGGLDGIMAQASDVLAKVNAMQLDRIAGNLQQATQRLAALSRSPEMTQGLQHLSTALANLKDVTAALRREAGPTLADLRQAAGAARAVVGQSGEVSGQPDTASLPTTLYEVRRAARSIRELADEIDRRPNALVLGK